MQYLGLTIQMYQKTYPRFKDDIGKLIAFIEEYLTD
jgi:hypothetical protein